MHEQEPANTEQTDRFSDPEVVGLSTRLLFAVPLLRSLVQAVAESDGELNFLNVSVGSGAWVGVARRSGEDQLLVSTNHGGRAGEPYPPVIHEALRGHGFCFDQERQGYLRFIGFETDDGFDETARLIAGTLLHVWHSPMDDRIRVELQLSLPPVATEVPD